MLYQSSIKSLQEPHHVFNTTTTHGGKTRSNEAIYAGGIEYVQMNGAWRRSPMTIKEMVAAAEEKLKTHPDECTPGRRAGVDLDAQRFAVEV